LQLQPLPPQLLCPLPLLQALLQLPEEKLSLELKTTLEMLWQPPYEEQGLGLYLVAEEKEMVEDNQLLSLYSNSSPSYQLPIYKS